MKLPIKIIAFICLLLVSAFSAVADTDFEKARKAANRGDFKVARAIWEKLSENGDSDSTYNLGRMYARGDGVKKDFARARELFSKASDSGHADATYKLGLMYLHGDGVMKDEVRARELFRKASDAGSSEAFQKVKDLPPPSQHDLRQDFIVTKETQSERQALPPEEAVLSDLVSSPLAPPAVALNEERKSDVKQEGGNEIASLSEKALARWKGGEAEIPSSTIDGLAGIKFGESLESVTSKLGTACENRVLENDLIRGRSEARVTTVKNLKSSGIDPVLAYFGFQEYPASRYFVMCKPGIEQYGVQSPVALFYDSEKTDKPVIAVGLQIAGADAAKKAKADIEAKYGSAIDAYEKSSNYELDDSATVRSRIFNGYQIELREHDGAASLVARDKNSAEKFRTVLNEGRVGR